MSEFSGRQYVPIESIGGTWSSPQGVNGIGASGAEIGIGEFRFPRELATIGTVTLGFRETFVAGAGQIGWLHAILQFGAGNAGYVVEMDWANGQSISIPLSSWTSVRVIAKQYGLLNSGVALSASFAICNRPGSVRPTHTSWLYLPAGAAGVPSQTVMDVPARAKTLFVPRRLVGAFGAAPTSDLEVRAEALGPGALAIWSHQVATDEELWTVGVELPQRATTIRILTLLGTQSPPDQNQPVVFGLDG
jgi:hypothetical protein